ncbi:hypothetical protein ACP70R_009958 [Stipagrostis hirtigluma subsp. patula]
MPPRSPDQQQGLGDGLWRLTLALLQALDVATNSEKRASPLWFSAVGDVTEGLLVELSSRGGAAAQDRIREVEAAAASAAVPPEARPQDDGRGLSRAIDGAVEKLEELTIRGDITWSRRSGEREGGAGAGAPAYVDALMADTVRILARCLELHPPGREDSLPSGDLRTKMCAAVIRVLGRCTMAVEFRRSVEALQSGMFEIKLGSGAHSTIRVKLDAIWPALSDLQRSCRSLRKDPGSGLRFYRLGFAIRAGDKGTLQLQPSHSRSSRRKGITKDDISNLLKECVSKGFRHECGHKPPRGSTYYANASHSNMFGREDIQENITMQLLSDDNKCKFSVICLAAKRGAGKTTLVHTVYNDQRVSSAFDLRLWLSMSDKFDEKVMMTAIIEHATQVQCDVMELKFLWQLVEDVLKERKFLLVLEDCQIEQDQFWRTTYKTMRFGAKGSAVIVTNKSEGSAPRPFATSSFLYSFNLSPLRDEHCLQILQQLACSDGHGPDSDQHLMRISSDILYSCRGNPLYIKAIYGFLCHAKSALQQLDNLKEAFSPDIKLCCDLLPHHMKLCLSLCSLFPKDYVFTRHHTIRLWMSQGFINREEFGNPEDIGTQYFNELICRSFFEHSSLHGSKEDVFVMPKLFHDMLTTVSKDVCFRSEDLLCNISEKICHLSLVPWERRTVVTLQPVTKQVGHLHTFLVVNRSEQKNSSMSSPFVKLEGLDDFLLKFKSLRTLNLSYTAIGQLPASVGSLKNLRYLAVNNTDVRKLPSELCLLENLQTLELRDCPQLVTLPEDIKNLATLRHLDVRKQPGYVRMPIGVGELIHLQSLPVLNVGETLSDCSIRELRHLDNLHGDLAITGLENIKACNDAKEAKLINKKYLETLTLEWSDNSIYLEEDDEEISTKVFENLQPPRDLVNLIVQNYSGSSFPIWIEKIPFDNLQSITLDNCYNCCVLPALGDLQSLRYLCIQKMYALKTFGYTPLPEKKSNGKFPALEHLKLWEMYELDGWAAVRDGDFPCLRNVSICGCPMLKSLPRLPSLVDLSFHRCDQLPEIPELVKLESLKIDRFQDTVSLDLPQGLPALKNLEISHCNELVSVVGLSTLSSIEKLKIVKCPKLNVSNSWQQYHFKKIVTTSYFDLGEEPISLL